MKDKKIVICLSVIILVLVGVIAWLLLKPEAEEVKTVEPSADALKFKEEYESLNGTIRESDGATYNNVTIPEDNPIVYVDTKGALDVLKNKDAILYVGAGWCPWCRNAVPVLFDAVKDLNVNKVYYLNLDAEKSNYEVKDKKLVKKDEGTEGYYALLDFLKDELRDYVITSDGKEYKTGEKRIYMPFVIAVKDGEVVATHNGTVSLNEGQTKYDSLTEKQEKELYEIYSEMTRKVIPDGKCNEECD